MKIKRLVTITNIIAIISVAVLLCWVVITIIVGAFGLKVLQERSATLFFSSLGLILALMFGALVLNIMLNLTRIAEKHNADKIEDKESVPPKKTRKRKVLSIALWLTLPLLVLFLFLGDYISTVSKENMLLASADLIVEENNDDIMAQIANYSFDKEWVNETGTYLHFLSRWDENYPSITVIVKDSVNGKNAYLQFTSRTYVSDDEDIKMSKLNYILKSNMEERLYLNEVFDAPYGEAEKRFNSYGNYYELFYPITSNEKTIVLLFSDRDSYGVISK